MQNLNHLAGAFSAEELPEGIRSRMLNGVNGLDMHILESGFNDAARPCLLLLHGFPELAYSWRKVMPVLADLGFHVVAPDQRGYGRTTGWQGEYSDDISPFSLSRMAGDIVSLVNALGYRKVAAVIGHDFGSPVAATCALIRPDVFQSVVLMSAPIAGPAAFREENSAQHESKELDSNDKAIGMADLPHALAQLPRPRKHYQWYYSGPDANREMLQSEGGLEVFFRNYYHHKSADWEGNQIFPLTAPTAEELAKLPTYYVMDMEKGMAETVAEHAPSDSVTEHCNWLTATELSVYAREYARTGFQGGLQCYRCNTSGRNATEMALLRGIKIVMPSLFIAGASDWGVHQFPGDLHAMQNKLCTNFKGLHLVEGAGHWVQQEQPEEVCRLVAEFLYSNMS
ncbi:MAG: alpha/beta fold hydrolase [Granulosicoccus sp.]